MKENISCEDCTACSDCRFCNHCRTCDNLQDVEYCINNVQYTKEEFFRQIGEVAK